MYTHQKDVITAGVPAGDAEKAIIMLHGRGASARDILSLQQHLNLKDTAVYAPQASQHSWYPYSFMAPEAQNQPALDSALSLLEQLLADIEQSGIPAERIYLLGFSQGACLSLEFAARHARRYGGIIAFTGGLIGQTLDESHYQGSFEQTPVFISTGDPDPHVPVERVNESIHIYEKLKAQVSYEIYPNRPHTILKEEISLVNTHILS